ncbi:class I SAM-dependent methyltransferase [Sphingomonas sp.]|uniref:class I SAM-dependent methyltransferase n=1 Tax=Sphingomonas sp. TaxID=28214 RepID=UPI0028A69A90|nr:class I SAM-dependent methyltransferase [Sphingomonas sp.]
MAASFIIDADPVFAYTGWNLVHSILRHTELAASDIHVQCTPEVSNQVVERFQGLGCQTHQLSRFGDGRYCNKLAQWENLRDQGVDHVVFLDTDMICIGDFGAFLPKDAIGGKVVDLSNPQLALLDHLFERAGFADRPPIIQVEASAGTTYQGNCNGGFYSVPSQFADTLFASWRKWAEQLLGDIEPLRAAGKEMHVDQIAFCMALHETALPYVSLPSNVNYYVHFPGLHSHFDPRRPLALIHYHNSSLNVLGLLEPVGAAEPHEADGVGLANELIREHFDTQLFWDLRYNRFPERGSGVGSRGDNLAYKRGLLISEGVETADSVLDVGCGDLEVVGSLKLHNYLGLDRSQQSLDVARSKRPDWQFMLAPYDAPCADFVICLEVLIHQRSQSEYRQLIEYVAQRTLRRLIISGYDAQGDHVAANHMIFFHEPLSLSLKATGRFSSIQQIGSHSDVGIYRCDVR